MPQFAEGVEEGVSQTKELITTFQEHIMKSPTSVYRLKIKKYLK